MRLEAAPVQRHWLRMLAGVNYYRLKRWLRWHNGHSTWASATVSPAEMPHRLVSHQTPLRRQLRNVDMWLQENKIANLRLALRRLDGLRLAPGETLSFWRQVGNPIALRGFKVGMALHNGRIRPEVGGGLCQLSNLIYWMTLHTPLTVTERWRHNYDVFPDADRILPFGSGATCFYNYIDLQIANRTEQPYSLHLTTPS